MVQKVKESEPLVSIVVPCYNQSHFLDDALESVLNQSYTNWECIIVNDGSPDDTVIIAQYWVKTDVRFKYVERENGGLSRARNTGIRFSEGTLILPLDADDILHKDYLSILVPVLIQNDNLAIVSCNTGFFTTNPNEVYFKLQPKGSEIKNLLYQNQLIATSLFKKTSWECVGGYDESMKSGFEDWEFWLRVLKVERKTYQIIPEILFYYRKSEESMLMDTVANYQEVIKKYIIQKHPELYIEDFHNFTSVQFYHLKTARDAKKAIKNSMEFKLGRVLLKPFKMLASIVGKNKFSNDA